ncbi:hypothetical protein [Metallosphaera javensis (ex Sakai et al. 2022)]|uniref:hypothetical protein n=1 Tax=Metallosphaera javensis (ex Sakai et al. 2022) TaxID=2775498 RepID=UPI002584DC16|nr:MAG: hypothetical protein MjAS7_1890 [Metallosphaera javensis (ex Sakai et al. 2022)]
MSYDPRRNIYLNLFSGVISEADIVNILGYIENETSAKELEERSGISRKSIYNWTHGKVETISRESRRKFLEALFDIVGVERSLLYLAKSKRVTYIRLLGALLENNVDISELQVIVHGNIITNKTPVTRLKPESLLSQSNEYFSAEGDTSKSQLSSEISLPKQLNK